MALNTFSLYLFFVLINPTRFPGNKSTPKPLHRRIKIRSVKNFRNRYRNLVGLAIYPKSLTNHECVLFYLTYPRDPSNKIKSFL